MVELWIGFPQEGVVKLQDPVGGWTNLLRDLRTRHGRDHIHPTLRLMGLGILK